MQERNGTLTRRRLLLRAAALAAGGVAVGVGVDHALNSPKPLPLVALGTQPAGLPERQYAWEATLMRDSYGNPIPPRYYRLLLFDVEGSPTPAAVRMLEAALRTLERAYRWGPSGLLFTAGWGPSYFEHALDVASPIPRAKGLSDFELPAIDDYDLCLHLACDDERRLAAVEAALRGEVSTAAALRDGAPHPRADGPLDLSRATLRWRETRTGFVGAGMPAAHQNVGGIPPGNPVPRDSPLFMGFKSSLRRNQATEEYVKIAEGPFAGGTTMQVSYMRLRLDSWYEQLGERERVALMYAPQVTPEQVDHFTTDAASDPALLGEAINRYGVIGHAQTSARARRGGKPLIIRRDFDTVDGGQAGLHFVSLQRTIEDFVTTRNAMNASSAQLENPAITDTVNNGINAFMLVLRRANYIVPSRPQRSFPLLPGREGALD
jgi:hypothetical protein